MHGDVDADRGPNREPYMVRMAICRQILEGATMQCRPGHQRFYTQHEAGRTTHVREIAGSHAGLAKRCSPLIPSEKNGYFGYLREESRGEVPWTRITKFSYF
jgi:hypothetical protein